LTNLTRAIRSNNPNTALNALREEIWNAIFDTDSGKDIAALVKRWLEVSNEIGDKRREPLEEIRDKLAAAIEKSNSGRDIASLSIRLLDVIRELQALPDTSADASPAQKAREMVRNRGTT